MREDLDDERLVVPDGLAIRGRRHAFGWSPRDLVEAIASAHERATGARVSYATLRLIAAGLDCNPVELIADGEGAPADQIT